MTVLRIITSAAIVEHRDVLCRWVEANGLDPHGIAPDGLTVEHDGERKIIRYLELQRTPEGRHLVDPERGDQVWKIERTAPLIVELDLDPADLGRSEPG